jgi:hypothetical protein
MVLVTFYKLTTKGLVINFLMFSCCWLFEKVHHEYIGDNIYEVSTLLAIYES